MKLTFCDPIFLIALTDRRVVLLFFSSVLKCEFVKCAFGRNKFVIWKICLIKKFQAEMWSHGNLKAGYGSHEM